MKPQFLLLLLLFAANGLRAQNKIQAVSYTIEVPATVQSKNYYLLTLLQDNSAVNHLLQTDASLAQVIKTKLSGIREGLTNCKDAQCLTETFKFTIQEIQTIGDRLAALYQPDNALGRLVSQQLIPSGTYSLYNGVDPKEVLLKAWQQDAQGINHTIAVYAQGQKPNYPAIDSISFKVHDKDYIDLVTKLVKAQVYEDRNTGLFFMPSMSAALAFLSLNDRGDAANYEPMETTVNAAAVQKIKTINWVKYPYTLILVPGEGPEEADVPLAPNGMLRCRLAADEYLKGIAPFIMVSGGKVHPYKTRYSEAEEMKRYLVHSLNIPENAIIMEPHARHTTTNMRDAARLMYQYNLPADKAAVVVSDQSQSAYITNMTARCIKELQYVPYRLGKRRSDTEQEFYPVKEAFQINAMEPLDP